MAVIHKKNLIIHGFGSASGGKFEDVEVNGKGTVNGDVNCERFSCNGLASVNGNLEAGTLKINGNGKIRGNVKSDSISIEGNGKLEGETFSQTIDVNGNATFIGNVKGDKIKVNGRAKIAGDCEAEQFSSEGTFQVEGLLNAEEIFIHVYGECKVKEIGGHSIVVKGKVSRFTKLIKSFFPVQLVTQLMEGNHLNIDYVKAEVVRGNNVTIGGNCNIDLVEYKADIHIKPGAKVREYKKI